MLPVSHGGVLDDAAGHHTDVRGREHDTIDMATAVGLEGLEWLSCPASIAGSEAEYRNVGPPRLAGSNISTAITVEVTEGNRKAAEVRVAKGPQPEIGKLGAIEFKDPDFTFSRSRSGDHLH